MIVIVADRTDVHSRHIKNRIEAAGGTAAILDFATLAADARIWFDVGPGGAIGHFALSDAFDLAEVRTVWLRRPSMVNPPAAVLDRAARTFIRHEWSAAVNGMVMAQDGVRWVNDPFAQNSASKPLQLHCAARVGLKVPDTLITNDPHRARRFVKAHRGDVVHKVLTQGEGRLLETRAWDESADDKHLDASLPLAPVIFQELVRGGDVRSVVVGDEVLSTFIDTPASRSPIDSRLDLDAAHTVHELPAEVAGKLCELMSALGLVFGVVDLKIDECGEYLFLEVNPQGQFMFMEILTGLPISDTLVQFLLSEAAS